MNDQSSKIAATTMMAVDESDILLVVSADGKSDCIFDSISAYHLCKDREMLSTYAACERLVWMANNTTNRVIGKGTIRFCMVDGRSLTLTEVRHVSSLQKN